MAISRYYSSVAVANSIGNTGGIAAGATSFYATTAPSGYPTNFPFSLRLEPGTANEEVVSVTAGSGTSATPWTVSRGFDGTTAKAHAQGAAFAHGMSAWDFSTSRTHENSASGSGVHGLPTSAWATASLAVLQEITLANSTTSLVTFSSIPQTYNHLLVFIQGRSNATTAQSTTISATVNGDTTAVYSAADCNISTLSGALTSPTSSTAYAQAKWPWVCKIAAASAGAAVNAGGGWLVLPNYAGTAFNKMFYGQSGMGNGSGSAFDADLYWGWYNPATQAGITTLAFTVNAGNFLTGSFLGLYGLS